MLKIPHVVFSSERADEALNQVDQRTSRHHWMLSGKPREIEPLAEKQKLVLSPVPLPKLGYIQITVTEVQMNSKEDVPYSAKWWRGKTLVNQSFEFWQGKL